jgi:mono/diheme cytochrome c family protein
MMRWGAVVTDAERPALLDALEMASRRPPKTGASQLTDGARGAAVFKQRCLTCHASDIVEQQRLAVGVWRREIDKMVGWGARLDESEREPLVAYLTERFGVR